MQSVRQSYRKIVYNSSIGNILEWYDFGLFSIFSGLFSRLFFPSQAGETALMETFAVFAVGFLCRPIGALIFGYLGDTRGRARTLRLSILMISLPTLSIGLLPDYHQAGVYAPIMLLLVRVWQGISLGGEYSGNLIYLAESAPPDYRATYTSVAVMGCNIGILLAAMAGITVSHLLGNAALEGWGWRLPYLCGGIGCLMIYFFRLDLPETQVFTQLKQQQELLLHPLRHVLKNNFPQLLRTLGMVCMGSTFYYFCFVYIPIYIEKNNGDVIHHTPIIMSIFIALMIILVPIAGFLCDCIGRRKMLLFNAALITTCTIPGFYFLQHYCYYLLVPVLLFFTVASSLEQGTTSVAVVENFPPKARYTGVSLGYNIGNGVLGGTVPVICEWLLISTSISFAPAIYIALCAAITGIIVFFFVPETRHASLSLADNGM
jgi:MHS family proline/betaine transporter-like MFS transporter